MSDITFGVWLQRERKRLRLTQAQLAEQIGCSAIALRKIEAEERRPSSQIIGRLAGIFAIVPSDRAAFLRFARGDWQAAPASILTGVVWRVERTTSGSHLPASLTSFIGRERDVAKVNEYLATSAVRLVTLIGPPGIGKTRLSLQVASEAQRHFADGAFFVSLASIVDIDLVAPTIAQALGLIQTDQRSAVECLKDGISNRQQLIVLDNFEQIVEAAPLIPELLTACPHLKLIVTSRESLRVPGEWLYPVPPLLMPHDAQLKTLADVTFDQFSALTLFAERARAVRPDFVLTPENVPTVSAICQRLDGLPLAIELIATRLRLMSAETLLERLNAHFILSADGRRAGFTRQKTLQNAIAWSYNLLSTEEQFLFARLSVFSNGFTREAAEAVLARAITDKLVSDLIALLWDKSLLQRTFDTHGEPRFTMLVTIQQFALERLRETGGESEVRAWHLAYFLDLAEQANRDIHGPDQIEWINRIGTEYDNYRAAIEWCVSNRQTEAALRLLGALAWVWLAQDRYSETRSWFDKIRSWPEITAYPEIYAGLLNRVGNAAWLLGDYDYARSVLEESRAIWLKLSVNGEQGLAESLDWLGMVALFSEGDLTTAQSFFEWSFKLYQRRGDRWGMAFVLLNLGQVAIERNDGSALALCEQSLDLFQQLGDVFNVARSSQWLGQLFLKQENFEKARFYFDQHLKIDEELHFRQGTVVALYNFGEFYRHQGDYAQAEHFYQKSLTMCREYGLKRDSCNSLFALGLLALHRNNYRLARRQFTDTFDLAWPIYGRTSACDLLTGLAAVAAGTKQLERAAKLYGAAQAAFETTDYRIPPFDRAEFDRHIQIARGQLGETAFEVLAAVGRAMTLEQAIEYALSDKMG